ncbi:MAG: hypothetical protein K2W85_04025 [Phycisphaerales bacterium]|nr:hypothetical protein [Phycisphaerales bacterium]
MLSASALRLSRPVHLTRLVSAIAACTMNAGIGLPILASVVGGAILAPVALADIRPVTPYVIAVTKPAPLSCGDGGIYYAVTRLQPGALLKIDGEGSGWLRAVYPNGLKAYVKVDEAAYDEATKTVKLTKGSKLMAANEGGARPWQLLLDRDLPAGTAFQNAVVTKGVDGTVEGYLVPAPSGARGFIKAELTRKATPEEAAQIIPPPAAPAPKLADAPKPADAAAVPPGATDIIEVKPAPRPGDQPKSPTPAPTSAAPMPAAVAQPTRPSPEVTKRIDDIALLRDMFDRVNRGTDNESEVQTVISEFNRKIDALGTTGEDGRLRRALEDRRGALLLKQEIIETRRRLRDTSGVDERLRMVRVAIEDVEKQAVYTIVGRILPSTVYDGKRGMPLMYRVESADLSSTRTVGYVVPREGIELLTKMGKMVGIVGDAKFDSALGLNIVAPMRVDELRIAGSRFEVVPSGPAIPAPGTGTQSVPSNPDPGAAAPAAGNPPSDPSDMNK